MKVAAGAATAGSSSGAILVFAIAFTEVSSEAAAEKTGAEAPPAAASVIFLFTYFGTFGLFKVVQDYVRTDTYVTLHMQMCRGTRHWLRILTHAYIFS